MKLFLAISLSIVHLSSYALDVVFVNPSIPGTPFWDRVTAVAKAAAEDLSINLNIVYGKDNRVYHLEAMQKVIAAQKKPDFVIFMPYDGNAVATFELLESANIPFITIERTLQKNEQALIGFPQQRFKYWLGEVFHDNIYAGRLLANELIKAAKKKQPENKHLVAVGIAGSFSGESSERNTGLKQAIAADKEVSLEQIVPAIWSRERSRNIIFSLNARFGQIDVAWAASDGMALGVLDSVKSEYRDLNQSMQIGGIDWTVEGIKEVEKGGLAVSVGGHFMQTAWALVKLYDHTQGIKIFNGGDMGKTYDLEAITHENIHKYKRLASKVDWQKIDFKRFSRTYTKQAQYDFSFGQMLTALE
ncbi:ABC transporter substrate-binding protein [Thalassotalea sediminis]|uniref:ABC transporter substrate-binding protein n=1 Tax=Thalassotalea sediminis TaxID=1759089 RepID=UPI0025728BD0|nr:ABC transporter substrate-binding protein [Thalassotalea sediminis]